MKWSLLELRKYQETPLTFHETLDLKADLMKRDNLILDVMPVVVKGLVSVDKKGYLVHYTVQTTLTVPSTRSLEPVELPMDFTVDELFMTKEQYQLRDDQLATEEILLIEEAKLDLTASIEDNILLAIPMRVLTAEEEQATELPKGTDWEVISEEEYERRKKEDAETKVDPRLAKLSELFDSSNEDDKA
ncbi:nucleic acid-binding protein [Enterococcus villorum]|jgi:uncharacterized protein|uniref:Nucleic acid-binding protein n=2 Tax=Enterococcus villorum TaxID=112904 RepID=A0A1V8YE06_9ENTE|nr:DUF177 domain-containing protein [Enterococcus villorum]EOH89483.1 nucleic acid-binding protein [Enterococcus villorum ATCC 700913]EOW75962.1 nucleic acid-binding protein [Enterococcus villorum ATCC 700913]OQO70841.1 nucleic acid-binding protein [Enterococcus villorum]OQO75063.1 nucleic acid-binding protein [Enterococcus villorum]GEL91626.1 hypothetical protein EVI01_09630 [Enterococcus villorum]